MRRFSWHPDARVFDPEGAEVAQPRDARFGKTFNIPEHPIGAALSSIFGSAGAAEQFCITRACCDAPDARRIEADVPGFCCLTSGSTGAPRVIHRSQESWCASFAVNTALFGLSPRDTYAALGALGHSLTLYAALEALSIGADLHLLCGMRPDRQIERLASTSVSVLYATPSQLRLLGAVPQAHLPDLRLLLVGGAALDGATRRVIAALAPRASIHEFYGASETSFVTLSDLHTPEGSVGRPYPAVTLSIRDRSGARVPNGNTGEVWVKSPYLFNGYIGNSAGPTRWSADGALTIGEIGKLDEAGNLWLIGRAQRMVTIADQNTYPEEVERCLVMHHGVQRAAALPVKDTRRGHVLVAVIERTAPVEDEALLRHCRRHLGALKAPRRIFRVEKWPLLPSGKTDLEELQSWLAGMPV